MNWVCVKEAERVDLEEYNRRVHFLSHDDRKKIVKLLKRVNTKQMMWLITFIRKFFFVIRIRKSSSKSELLSVSLTLLK